MGVKVKAKTGKKVKKTKAELEAERLLREEEERKAKALEDKRLAELQEKKRQEDIKLQAERREYRENELSRLNEEYKELLADLEYKERERLQELNRENGIMEWQNYQNPDDEPDAKNERDMNTFVSIMTDVKTEAFSDALDNIRRIELIAKAMDNYWSDCLADQNIPRQMNCEEYLAQFYSLIMRYLDAATSNSLKYMDNHLNEKMEFNLEEVATDTKLGMWVSLNETRLTRKALVLEKVGMNLEIPKPFLHHDTRFIIRIVKMPVDIFSTKIYAKSLQSSSKPLRSSRYYVLGHVLNYDVIIPPPQPYILRAKKWVFREIKQPSDVPKKSPNYPVAVPTKCFIKVPENVIMTDDVRVASWNHELMEWTEDGLTDYQYNESENTVQFYTSIVGTFALVKERVVEFPYKKWSLRPMAPDISNEDHFNRYYEKYVRLTICTSKHDVVIDVIGTKCRLVRPTIPQVSDLIGVDISPGQLVRKLLSKGINICPVYEDSEHIAGNVAKVPALEDDVLRTISYCSHALDFESSTWNKDLPSSNIGILVRESTVSTGSADTFDFECVLAETDSSSESYLNAPSVGLVPGVAKAKYTLVVGNDYGGSSSFSTKPRPHETTHVNFALSLSNRISAEAKERIERGNARFGDTVYTLLKLVKPFSF